MTLGPLSEIRETGEGRLKNKMCSSFCPEGLCKRHLSRGVNKAEGYWKHQRQGCETQAEESQARRSILKATELLQQITQEQLDIR